MGNRPMSYVLSSAHHVQENKAVKRKRGDSFEEERDKIQEEILNTPKRKKLTSTSTYIYETLYKNGENSDVRICALGKVWQLHRVYLCQSGYFSSMFRGDWKESSQDKIDISIPDENIDVEALDIAFGSLYKDDVSIKPTMVIHVLAAATLLSLDGLIQQCVSVMKETVSSKTVCTYHIASVMYGQKEVTKECSDWLERNLMTSQTVDLLKEISIELMTEVVESPDLFVMQVEMDVYSLLKKWLYVQLTPSWEGSLKDLGHEADTYFRESGREKAKDFLDLEIGRPYEDAFKALRLCHVINDLTSSRIMEEDSIVPKSWLLPVYRKQWLQMLKVEQGNDIGPEAGITAEIFAQSALRCGRILQKDGQYCWRWTGFNFGLDLLVSFTNRLVLFKRNTMAQNFPGSVSVQNKRHLLYKLTIASFDQLGHTTYHKSTGVRKLTLGKDEETVIMALDRKCPFPFHISCNFMVFTPKEELRFYGHRVPETDGQDRLNCSHNNSFNENEAAANAEENSPQLQAEGEQGALLPDNHQDGRNRNQNQLLEIDVDAPYV